MRNVTDFHGQFAQALLNPEIDSTPLLDSHAAGDQRRRFDVYRNNRTVSLIDGLSNSYPVLNRLLGDEFFEAAARAFVDHTPPAGPVMAEYGADFGSFVASLPNTASLPYLRDIAQLEWRWLQAYHSEDASVLQADTLQDIDALSLIEHRLQSHPALFAMQSHWPIGSIWQACTQHSAFAPDYANIDVRQPQAVVITRPELQVLVNVVPESGYVFLGALQRGTTIGMAAEEALACNDTFDAGTHLTGLLTLGAFSAIEPNGI